MKMVFILLLFLFIPASAWAKTSCVSGIEWSGDKGEKPDSGMSSVVTMNLDAKNKTVTIALKNTTHNDIRFVDSIRVAKDAPEFFGIMARDKSHHLVTGTRRGYRSFNAIAAERSSDDRPHLPKQLTTLHPGGKISRVVKISDVVKGTQKLWKVPPDKLDTFSVRFVLRLYQDEEFFHYTECDSAWFFSSDNTLLEAPDPIEWGTTHVSDEPRKP